MTTTQINALALAQLATSAVAAYVAACASSDDASLEGLLEVERANADTWLADGYSWADVRAALVVAWGE